MWLRLIIPIIIKILEELARRVTSGVALATAGGKDAFFDQCAVDLENAVKSQGVQAGGAGGVYQHVQDLIAAVKAYDIAAIMTAIKVLLDDFFGTGLIGKTANP